MKAKQIMLKTPEAIAMLNSLKASHIRKNIDNDIRITDEYVVVEALKEAHENDPK